MPGENAHRWKFIRSGGVDQVSIRTGEDIVRLPELDQKLWVALACPTRGLEFDPRTLDLIDTDHDGRIRAPEIIEASQWIKIHLRDPDLLLLPGDELPLSAINDASPSGALLLKGARIVLQHLGKPENPSISLSDVLACQTSILAAPLNGDGTITPDSTSDPELKKLIEEIITTVGAITDRSGKPGLNAAKIDAFFAEAAAFDAWSKKPGEHPELSPIGPQTEPAAAAVLKLKPKVDDFFARCALAAYDSRSTPSLNPAEPDYRNIAANGLDADSPAIAELPLFTIQASQSMPLDGEANPAWRSALEAFRVCAVDPLLGGTTSTLTPEAWQNLQQKLAPYYQWQAARPDTRVGSLGLPRLRELLSTDAPAKLKQLAAQDASLEPAISQIAAVEKLLRLRRDFLKLLNNFVSFSEFYARRGATFQAGTLYLDARACDLTVRVADPAKHAALAGLARACLAYCDCTRPGEKMSIAAAFTAGDSEFLMVGRNGIFYDRHGRDWDATITKIIDNPISVRQAFLSPYKKFVRMIEELVAKRAAASDAEAQGKLSSVATNVATIDKRNTPPGQPAPLEKRRVDVGTVAALGVALGSISTVLVAIFARFFELGWWIPVGLLCIILAISGPSMLIAWLKLRQRNLGPILDANGWAINGRMRINVPFGGSLSKTAKLPPGAIHTTRDPFAENHTKRNLLLILALLLLAGIYAWRLAWLDQWLPERWRREPSQVEQSPTFATPAPSTNAPAEITPPN